MKDPKFPKQDRQAQEEFIADSLAGDGRISIRRSRDICGDERTKEGTKGRSFAGVLHRVLVSL